MPVGQYEKTQEEEEEEEADGEEEKKKKQDYEQGHRFPTLTREDIVPRSSEMWRRFVREKP